MKKIALFSLMCCLGMINAYGANQCKTSITFDWRNNNWNAGANEYLFETKRDYMDAINSGYFYECDSNDSSNCGNNTYVEVDANHVFQDRTIREKAIYKCETGALNDKWVKVNSTSGLTKCAKKIERYSQFQNFSADEYLYPTVKDYDAVNGRVYSQVYECDSSVCTNGTIITLPAGHVFGRNDISKQRKYKCVLATGDDQWVDITDDCEDCDKQKPQKKQCFSSYDGKTFNVGQSDTFSCDKYPEVDPNKQYYLTGKNCYRTCLEKSDGGVVILQSIKECKDNTYTHIDFSSSERARYKTTIPGFKKCEKKSEPVKPGFCDKYKQWDKRYACCLAGKDTEWKGKDLSNDGTCVCKDGSNWEYNEKTKRGKCVANGTPVPPVVEEEGECDYYFTGSIECANGNQYFERKVVKLPKSKINKECGTDILKTDVDQVMELMKKLCETTDIYVVPPQTGPSPYEVEQAQNVLSSFTASAKDEASVWKTAEGNFNGARLASDITAGVVLGTVGGVVTGNIIKKNQVKKGFEALHCTVGGQKVADWGDEFSVGLQR